MMGRPGMEILIGECIVTAFWQQLVGLLAELKALAG
jgi:hypothetical protein